MSMNLEVNGIIGKCKNVERLTIGGLRGAVEFVLRRVERSFNLKSLGICFSNMTQESLEILSRSRGLG